jgi:hypothetical protein
MISKMRRPLLEFASEKKESPRNELLIRKALYVSLQKAEAMYF